MQIGTRWRVGAPPPSRLPAAVVAAVHEVESRLDAGTADRARWTLTWLEGRPVVELDDGTTIRVLAGGSVVTHAPDEDADEEP